jgi:hypothetical protein
MDHSRASAFTLLLGLVGAIVGGAIGYFAFFWISQQGFYALVLPGGLLGLGAGSFARARSIPLAVICCIAALGLGLYTEWRFAPFVVDGSFTYLVTHALDLKPITLIMLGLGTFLGYRLALRG